LEKALHRAAAFSNFLDKRISFLVTLDYNGETTKIQILLFPNVKINDDPDE